MKITSTTNVVKFCEATNYDQMAITEFLRKAAKLRKSAPVYFDDADLVWIDQTIVPNALVNSKLSMQDLVDAVVQATA